MKTIFSTVLAILIILVIWAKLASTNLQPELPPPPPRPTPIASNVPDESPSVEVPPTSPTPAPVAPSSVAVRALSPTELELKARLEKQVSKEVPTHRITIDQTRVLTGWLVSENSNQVTFLESYGNTGSMSVNIRRKRIVSLETLTNLVPIITDRDVRFQTEFPTFNFFKRAPYTIVTDESFFQVERIVRDLQKTYGQFISRFKPLVRLDRESASDIQVLVFSSQSAFRRYAHEHFHGTNDIAGFYVLETDRLVVFNQTSANWIQDVIHEEETDAIARYGDSPELRRQLEQRRGSRESDLKWFAKLFTLETVRHEGAHQMSYTLGVLHRYPRDLTWLAEGLALYSETETLGSINPWRVEELKRHFPNNNYPAIDAIMAASYQDDYLNSYSSYWALTYFLMGTQHRTGFLKFIRHLNDPVTWQTQPIPTDMEFLCQALSTNPDSLDKQWRTFLQHL